MTRHRIGCFPTTKHWEKPLNQHVLVWFGWVFVRLPISWEYFSHRRMPLIRQRKEVIWPPRCIEFSQANGIEGIHPNIHPGTPNQYFFRQVEYWLISDHIGIYLKCIPTWPFLNWFFGDSLFVALRRIRSPFSLDQIQRTGRPQIHKTLG